MLDISAARGAAGAGLGAGLGEEVAAVDPLSYWLAAGIFVLVFVGVVSEKVHKAKAALAGAAATMALPILSQHEAFHSEVLGIDHDVIFLLIGMMILVNVISRTGIFEWAAIRAVKLANGQPLRIMAMLAGLTAVASAFLDNVTTVMLVTPITLLIAEELEIDAVPVLMAEVLASNIGGAATLIGDPPNIIIASKAELTFVEFLDHMGPPVVLVMLAFLGVLRVAYGKRLVVKEERRQRILAMDERKMIRDPVLARKSLAVLALTLVGFMLHAQLHLEPATVALCGAATLLLVARGDPHEVFAKIEWSTIFFFMGLFIVVGGLVKVGLIHDISQLVIDETEPNAETMKTTALVVLWASGLLSAVVDNIPYVATMTPLVQEVANTVFHAGGAEAASLPQSTLHHPVLLPVWWSLALGSCLGGNATAIGASANVVLIGIAGRSGVRITFVRFLGLGVPVTLMSLVISHVYVLLRYY